MEQRAPEIQVSSSVHISLYNTEARFHICESVLRFEDLFEPSLPQTNLEELEKKSQSQINMAYSCDFRRYSSHSSDPLSPPSSLDIRTIRSTRTDATTDSYDILTAYTAQIVFVVEALFDDVLMISAIQRADLTTTGKLHSDRVTPKELPPPASVIPPLPSFNFLAGGAAPILPRVNLSQLLQQHDLCSGLHEHIFHESIHDFFKALKSFKFNAISLISSYLTSVETETNRCRLKEIELVADPEHEKIGCKEPQLSTAVHQRQLASLKDKSTNFQLNSEDDAREDTAVFDVSLSILILSIGHSAIVLTVLPSLPAAAILWQTQVTSTGPHLALSMGMEVAMLDVI
ncbi:hypothetical protein AGABI2DRAFT_123146 [Agaricus bisporus var. bisporus H97]|uniref:hypothetical protein n=1 Tax=Agaricus bisporus var. bisporus (strain H97 / ATCC MYA-4626 / FGSC 10389) TaxID=936046 RepID=UPI00029F6047|nr:hypothetical protein AGABI2DRAFT_123146 [Agaricus bisporus var. bisporus H97]EKV42026.1 hypothetical protein AGABI2DRAFT_123146 [Agaricus bisporus var. bisporus H97]